MARRRQLPLDHLARDVPPETRDLDRDGHAIARSVLSPEEVRTLRDEVLGVYERFPADERQNVPEPQKNVFRYYMVDRSPACLRFLAHPRVLDILEPLVGEDCHLINCTAWRNAPGPVEVEHDYYWHTDGGPHVPRAAGVPWPDAIPFPIFVIAAHVYLQDCTIDDGPTTCVPSSHRSGQPPPAAQRHAAALQYDGRDAVEHVVRAGDVGFFVSDVWHRRSLPTADSKGRLFLQANYGRRDIAQRLRPNDECLQVQPATLAMAASERERSLLGRHPPGFYDG